MKTLQNIKDLNNKTVVMRVDFNVPIDEETGKVKSNARILAVIPTVKYVLDKGGKVVLLSHLGRPTEGQIEAKFSLLPVAERFSELTGLEVQFCKDYLNGHALTFEPGKKVILCENVRFNPGEKKNNEELAKKMAALGDIFVMDAFATSHRAEASTCGIAKFAKEACAGLLIEKEVDALSRVMKNPVKPLLAIVGGSKVSTKLLVLENLISKVNALIIGGGILNTFLVAKGFNVGKSLYEADLVADAKRLLDLAKSHNVEIPMPIDVVVGKNFDKNEKAVVKDVHDVADDDMILDVGPKTAEKLAKIIEGSKTILWNGPVGVFEFDQFANGTKVLAEAIVASTQKGTFSVAGGGDTISAIEKFDVKEQISYISTAGGAFLEFIEGKVLPGIAALD